MSQPLSELRNLLVASQTVRGRVISVVNGFLRVATADGVVEVLVENGVGIGDAVVIRNGRVIRVGGAVDVPVFHV